MEERLNPFYAGCTPTELSRLFRVPPGTIRDSIVAVQPTGRRGMAFLYRVDHVAPRIVKAQEDETEAIDRILKMHHTDLPKMLSKEYWYAQTQKQKYDIAAGNLWATEDVVRTAGDAFKTIRLSLQLMSDTVERNEVLTETQRQTILDLVDATLNDMREKLIDAFENRRAVPTVDEETPSVENDRYADL